MLLTGNGTHTLAEDNRHGHACPLRSFLGEGGVTACRGRGPFRPPGGVWLWVFL